MGIGRAKDMIADIMTHGKVQSAGLREPIVVHDVSIIRLMDTLKRSRGQLVLVSDRFGTIQGLVTPIDVFEAIAGEFPDEDETPDITADAQGAGRSMVPPIYTTLNRFWIPMVWSTTSRITPRWRVHLLERFGHLPSAEMRCDM